MHGAETINHQSFGLLSCRASLYMSIHTLFFGHVMFKLPSGHAAPTLNPRRHEPPLVVKFVHVLCGP
jgi:hypothetical protein